MNDFEKQPPGRILIIRLSSLGDVLLASPLIRALRVKFPEARIDFLVREEYAPLVRHHPELSEILTFDIRDGFGGLRKLRGDIRRREYDVILDIHRSLRSVFLRFGWKFNPLAKTRVYTVNKNQLARFLLVKFKINLYRVLYGRARMVWEKYIRTAAPLGVAPDNQPVEFYLPAEPERTAEEFLQSHIPEQRFFAVAPGARHFTKRWPAESFIALIRLLHEKYGLRTILLGGPGDVDTAGRIFRELPQERVINAVNHFSLPETAGIIRRTALFIGNDSGLMHAASAFQTPSVVIFGSTVRELGFFPHNPAAAVIENEGLYCRPCSHIGRPECPEKHFRCMREIAPRRILSAIAENPRLNARLK